MQSVHTGHGADRHVSEEDRAYFYHRAERQIELAERADSPEAVSAHMALAEHYMALCDAAAMLDAARADHDGLRPLEIG